MLPAFHFLVLLLPHSESFVPFLLIVAQFGQVLYNLDAPVQQNILDIDGLAGRVSIHRMFSDRESSFSQIKHSEFAYYNLIRFYRTYMFVVLLAVCVQAHLVKQELEIGLISIETSRPSQVQSQVLASHYSQLVQFETPFHRPPRILLALVEHSYSGAFFAKAANVTEKDFILQFFSLHAMNVTYRYLATIDDRIEINCTNFRVREQFFLQMDRPFSFVPKGIVFLTGIQQQGSGKLDLSILKSTPQGLRLQVQSENVSTVGICALAGSPDAIQVESTQEPRVQGSTNLEGKLGSVSLISKVSLECTGDDCEGSYFSNASSASLEGTPTPPQAAAPKPSQEELSGSLLDLKDFFRREVLKEKHHQTPRPQNVKVQSSMNKLKSFIENADAKESDEILGKITIAAQSSEARKQSNTESLDDEIETSVSEDDSSEDEDDCIEENGGSLSSSSIDFQFQISKLKDAFKQKNEGQASQITAPSNVGSPNLIEKPRKQTSKPKSAESQREIDSIISKLNDGVMQIQKNAGSRSTESPKSPSFDVEPQNVINSIEIVFEVQPAIDVKAKAEAAEPKDEETASKPSLTQLKEIKKFLDNQPKEISLQQRESHLKSLKKALTSLVQVEQESEPRQPELTQEAQVQAPREQPQQMTKLVNPQEVETKAPKQSESTYESPLFSSGSVVKEAREKAQVEREYADYDLKQPGKDVEQERAKKPNLRIGQKLESYLDKFSADQLVNFKPASPVTQMKEQELIEKIIEKEEPEIADQMRKYQEEFELKKKQKLEEIKAALKLKQEPQSAKPAPPKRPEVTGSPAADDKLKSYKEFFFG